jgi:hypothetical protein
MMVGGGGGSMGGPGPGPYSGGMYHSPASGSSAALLQPGLKYGTGEKA